MTSLLLHNTFFEIQVGGQIHCTVSKFKAFSGRFVFESIGKRAKTDLIILLLLNAKYLSKIIML